MKKRRFSILASILALAALPLAARSQTASVWQGNGSTNFSNGNWSDSSLWNPMTVPNNGGGNTYNVSITADPNGAQFNGPQVDIDVTISNLTLINRVFVDNQFNSGTNLTVTGTTSFTTAPGHDGEYGAIFFAGGTLSLGTLSNYNAATRTLTGPFLFPLNGGTIQFRNADVVTNSATIIVGDGSQILDQNTGLDAFRNLAVNNGLFNLGGGHNFTTAGDFTNNGSLAAGTSTDGLSSVFTVGGALTNYDPETHTLSGGEYSVGTNGSTGSATIRFAGADVETLANATVSIEGALASITDLDGNNAFRHLNRLDNANFRVGSGTFTPTGGTLSNNGGSYGVTSGSATTIQGNYTQTGGQTNIGAPTASAGTTLVITGAGLINGGSADFGGQPGVNTLYFTTLEVRNGLEFRGAFLTGTGTIIADTLFTNGSTIAPGHSPGELSFQGALLFDSSTTLQLQIGGLTPGSGHDLISQTGAFTLTLGGTLELTVIDGFEQSILGTDQFAIITSENLLAGAFENVASGERLATSDGLGSFLVTYAGSNQVLLSDFQSAVPEPGTYALVGLGGLGLWWAARSKRQRPHRAG